MYKPLIFIVFLTGCPLEPDIPDVPTTAICTDDRFLFNPATQSFILNPEGGALACDLE